MPKTAIIFPSKIDLNQFIYAQSHDLRSPFNSITGFSKMLLNNADEAPLTDSQKEDLGTIYRNGMRALARMNGLIDIARLNCQEKSLELKEVNLQQLIEQSQAQWQKFFPDSAVHVKLHNLAPSTTIRLDESLARQIVAGFIAYVALYCAAGAKVTVMIEEETDRLLFTFASRGIKAPKRPEMDLEMLGYINAACVEQHGGEIRLAEENDEGALVQLALPKA